MGKNKSTFQGYAPGSQIGDPSPNILLKSPFGDVYSTRVMYGMDIPGDYYRRWGKPYIFNAVTIKAPKVKKQSLADYLKETTSLLKPGF